MPKNENLCLLSTTQSFKSVYSIELQFHKEMKPKFGCDTMPQNAKAVYR